MKERLTEKEKKLEEDQMEMFPDHFQVLKQTARGYFNSSSPTAGVEGEVGARIVGQVVAVVVSIKIEKTSVVAIHKRNIR